MKKLVLKKELFTIKNINEARRAYKDIASIIISEKKDCAEVYFIHCKYDEKRTVREFENYLIGLENMQA